MDPNTIIDALGGTNAVARECEISPQAVSKWRKLGIPKPWMRVFRLQHPVLFGIKKERRKLDRREREI